MALVVSNWAAHDRAFDERALVTCDPIEGPLTEVAARRPVFALLVQDGSLAERVDMTPVPVEVIRLPWGRRYPDIDRSLYRLLPEDGSP
jgi:hypothetical protein